MKIDEKLFKAYDIRGIYPAQINNEFARVIGEAFGKYMGRGKKVAIGLDVRLSGKALMASMLEGIASTGVEVNDLGMAPTPFIYFAIIKYGLDGGMIVTASHNPKEWNGFKLYGSHGSVIGLGSGLERVMELAKKAEGKGSIESLKTKDLRADAMSAYRSFLLGSAHIKGRLSIGIDPGNGSYSGLASSVLREVGLEVTAINDTPDGSFPSRSPEPKPESIGQLVDTVKSKGLDFGVAFDADGDRAIFVDEKGNVLRGDISFALFVRHILKRGESCVYEVSCSKLVEDEIAACGGKPIISRVGRAFILNRMMDEKASLGGETSGHTYFSEANNADDALFAAIKMAWILSSSGTSLSELVSEMPRYETSVRELDVDEEVKFRTIDILRKRLEESGYRIVTLDGVKVMRDDGWFILRASNTSPKIRLIAESDNKEGLEAVLDYAMVQFNTAYADASA